MCVFELPISHIPPSRACRKSIENQRERGADQRAIGSHNANRLISLVKVCVHTCVRSICVPTLSGWDSIRQESAKKYEALILLQKLVNQKRATVLGRPIDLT